jgi:hypothetical protein
VALLVVFDGTARLKMLDSAPVSALKPFFFNKRGPTFDPTRLSTFWPFVLSFCTHSKHFCLLKVLTSLILKQPFKR